MTLTYEAFDVARSDGQRLVVYQAPPGTLAPADVEWAAATGAASLVNIRISKCGGLLPSLRTAVRARQLGLCVQVGVWVGEIGPLWSVGRTLAAWLADAEAVECGRHDEWILAPLTDPPYAVDREHHTAPPPPGPGHGLRPAALTAHLTG